MATRRVRLGMGGLAMAAVLVAASCGGDNSSSSSASSPVSLPGQVNNHGQKDVKAGDTVEMEADDFYFGPTFIKGPAGAKVTISLHNEGKADHTFTIDSAKIDQALAPDAKATVDVTLPASGVLAFYCKFHQSRGMQGAFFTG